jgi:DNA-binding transcriptional ArsR family regulator
MPSAKRKAGLGKLAAARRRDLFFVLGEPTRRSLIELIAQGEQPFARLAKFFPTTRQAVHDHLSVLRQAGLVSTRFAGNRRYYRLRNAKLREIRGWLAHYEQLWSGEKKFTARGRRPRT